LIANVAFLQQLINERASISAEPSTQTTQKLLLSWNPTGPTRTPTPTLGMCPSCNFVNVYSIVYHVGLHVHVYMCASPTDILARKSARVGQKSADKSARIVVRVRLVASWTGRGRPTSARGRILAPRGSRRRSPCRCRSRGI